MDKALDRYDISKDVLFGALEKIDVVAVAAAQTPWWNRTLTEVNDAVVRIGVFDGDFHWHQHENEDEFFYVLEGDLTIEIEGAEPVRLAPGQGVTVPKGRMHLPRANGRVVALMVEKGTVVPTGS
ncbi:MAG TPA: cupin domain-containing protein [Caulobacteraceae bacterium]|nr:cupin domain-containing protein [Caulobacteraceae bacterium]